MRWELKLEDVIRTKDETGAGQRGGWKESVAGREKGKGGRKGRKGKRLREEVRRR